MPIIPVYQQQTPMRAVAKKPLDLENPINKALAGVGKSLMQVGEVTGEIVKARQKQADNLWMSKALADAQFGLSRNLSEAQETLTDEEQDTAIKAGTNALMDKFSVTAGETRDRIRATAPSEAAQVAFDERFAGIHASANERAMAYGAARKVDYMVRSQYQMNTAFTEQLRNTTDPSEAHDLALLALTSADFGVEAIPADPATKDKVRRELHGTVQREWARWHTMSALANHENPADWLNNPDNPILAGMNSEERSRAIDRGYLEYGQMLEEQEQVKAQAQKKAKAEVLSEGVRIIFTTEGGLTNEHYARIGAIDPTAVSSLQSIQAAKRTAQKSADVTNDASFARLSVYLNNTPDPVDRKLQVIQAATGVSSDHKETFIKLAVAHEVEANKQTDAMAMKAIDARFDQGPFANRDPEREDKKVQAMLQYNLWRANEGAGAEELTAVTKAREIAKEAESMKTFTAKKPAPLVPKATVELEEANRRKIAARDRWRAEPTNENRKAFENACHDYAKARENQ